MPWEGRGLAWRWEVGAAVQGFPGSTTLRARGGESTQERGEQSEEGRFTNGFGGGADAAGPQAPKTHGPQGCAAPFAITESKAKPKTGTQR